MQFFLTHFHNDHIADLGEVMQRSYMLGREKELVVYGPTGTEQIVEGFNSIYEFDSDHRTEHHGQEVMPLEYQFATASEFDSQAKEALVYEKDGVIVKAFMNSHPPIDPTFGYIIEFKDKKIVISGDTLITEELAKHSTNADLLVIDVMNYELVKLLEDTFRENGEGDIATIMYDIREYHADVNDSARMAEEQGVKRIALTHFAPSPQNNSIRHKFYTNPIKEVFSGEIYDGGDGTKIVIPIE